MQSSVRQLFRDLADVPREEWDRFFSERRIPVEVRAEVESLLTYDTIQENTLGRRVTEAAEDMIFQGQRNGRRLSCRKARWRD